MGKEELDEKIVEYQQRTNRIPNIHRRSFFLLLTPEHTNMGDHAIAEAEKKFFHDYFPHNPLYEINYFHYVNDRENIKKKIKKRDVVVITGGGYLGSVWAEDDEMVRSIIREFPDNEVVVLPQTIYYTEDAIGLFKDNKHDYENHHNLLFCVRDKGSDEILKELDFVGKSKHMFMPDMVLYLNEADNQLKRDVVGLSLRNDREKVLDEKTEKEIISTIGKYGDVFSFNMLLAYSIGIDQRKAELRKKFDEFKKCKFVITDRLHAMLFATITGTPCVAMDNLTKKVSGVYPWIETVKYIQICKSVDDLEEMIEVVLQSNSKYDNSFLKKNYDELALQIKERFVKWRLLRG